MTAVIYARYSSGNQREKTIEDQIRECTACAEKNDVTVEKHYIDRAISAKTDNRPRFQQMIRGGVKLMPATEIISDGPENIVLESVLERYVEYYSADLAEKVAQGQTENILKGRCNRGRSTFDYMLDSERRFHIGAIVAPFGSEAFER